MKHYGFSLIELLVVIAIIGLLASVGIVSYNGYVVTTKKTSAKNIMQQMALAQTEYLSNEGKFFESTGTCDTTSNPSKVQREKINTKLLEADTLTEKLGYNACIIDHTGETPPPEIDYTIVASDPARACIITLTSNMEWSETGDDC